MKKFNKSVLSAAVIAVFLAFAFGSATTDNTTGARTLTVYDCDGAPVDTWVGYSGTYEQAKNLCKQQAEAAYGDCAYCR